MKIWVGIYQPIGTGYPRCIQSMSAFAVKYGILKNNLEDLKILC